MCIILYLWFDVYVLQPKYGPARLVVSLVECCSRWFSFVRFVL